MIRRLKVRFKEPMQGYVKGDVATFDKDLAEVFIRKGFAVRLAEVEVSDRSVHGPDLTRGKSWADRIRKDLPPVKAAAKKSSRKA